METRQIACFLSACDYGSIAAAAERLNTVASNVSLQIRQLEHELGIDLCRRSNSGLSLTEAGERFYRIALGMTDDVTFVSRFARSSPAGTPVRIGLAVPIAPRGSMMAKALRDVARRLGSRHPHVQLRLYELPSGATGEGDEMQMAVSAGRHAERVGRWGVRDRWGLVARRGEIELPQGEVELPALADVVKRLRMVLPAMPTTLAGQAEDFAGAIGATFVRNGVALSELEKGYVGAAHAVLLPLSCIPGFSQQQRFQVSYAEPHPTDPVWGIRSLIEDGDPIRDEVAALFHAVLRDAIPGGRPTGTGAQPMGGLDERRASTDEGEPFSLRQLKAFDTVYERGNISRAATELNVSQPALSSTLKKLEGMIGHKLFMRTAHGVMPTDRAVALRSLCEPLLQDAAQARRQLRDLGTRGLAPLRVGVLPVLDDESLLAVTIADAIDEWSRLATGCELQLKEGYSSPLRRWTVQEMLDLAIVDNNFRQSGLLVTPLARDAMVVVTCPDFHLLPAGPVRAHDVSRLRLILPSERHGLRGLIQRAFAEAGIAVTPKLELDSMAMTLNLVKMDSWATVLPVSAIFKRARAGEVQINRIVDPPVNRGLSLVRRTGGKASAHATRFTEILVARIRDAVALQQGCD